MSVPVPAPAGKPVAVRKVATVITRLEGGAGQHALRGVLSMDPDRFEMTLITGSGDPVLLDQAAAAGLEVITEPALRAPIAPRSDLRALARLRDLLDRRPFDIVHTHTAKAGVLGRLAAHRAGVPRLVHTYHGFPFHEFQAAPRRQAYVQIERSLGRITDLALCVGTGVAVEAVRRRLISPERIRTIGVVADGPAPAPGAANGSPLEGIAPDGGPLDGIAPDGGAATGGALNGAAVNSRAANGVRRERQCPGPGPGGARPARRRDRGRRGGAADLPEGARGLPGRPAGAGPAGRDRGLGR